ncbi:hypothetical protein BS78_04G053000 [Paspalum vaginatum]|nr:hypothetical protein BS78_04G053000 [Paspalum vaginatum]
MKGEIAATTAMVLLLLALGADAELCFWHSRTYRGWCHQNNCAAVCETEGYTGGLCQGLVYGDCMCSKHCNEVIKPPPPEPATPSVPLPPPAKPVAPPTPVVAPPKPPVVVPPVAVPAPVLPTPPPPAACKPPALEVEEKEAAAADTVTVRARRAGGHA